MHVYQSFKYAVRQAGPALAALLALCAPPAAASAQSDIILSPSTAAIRGGNWVEAADSTAAEGRVLAHPNRNAAKLTTALASPTHYFELEFDAVAGVPYRLWLHGRAEKDHWANDSVFVQFNAAVTATGVPAYRIGTTSAAWVNLEECSGCGVRGWTWQDNGYGRGTLGPALYFATTGPQRLRVQTREDGISIDQVLLSPSTYLNGAPTELLARPAAVAVAASTELKVLHWNIHHGLGTDNVYSIDRLVNWIVVSGANVVSLNEVEKFVGGYGYEDQPARFASLLAAKTGSRWYYHFAHRSGGTKGQGNLLLSTFPFEDTDTLLLSYARSVGRI